MTTDFDLIISGGTVHDGGGGDGVRADVGLSGDRIAAIGDLSAAAAARIIDATGLAVCPGFIDPHTHCHVDVDKGVLHCDNLLRQGITTVIAGNCGGSGWPVAEHLGKVEQGGFKSNYGMLVGHHTVRRIVTEGADSPWPTLEQTAAMQEMVRQGLDEGALGVTVGYARRHETFEEIVAFTRPAAETGTIYASHIRSEDRALVQGVAEAIEVAHQTGIAVQISHLKTNGPANWDKLDLVLEMIEGAVAMGLDVAADRYPYVGWHGGSTNIMTPWCYEEARKRGGREHLADADIIEHFRQEVADLLRGFGGPDRLMFTSLSEPDPEIDGRTVADLMAAWGVEAIEVALEIERRNEDHRIGAVGFTMSEDNLRRILAHPLVMIGTDAHLEVFGRTATHPRNYGTYPRVLGRYVRDEGLMPLGEAIRKMTSMPAERYGLRDRGRLQPGCFADVVILDPATVTDNAIFADAHQYPTGTPYVIVNGRVAVDNDVTAPEHFGRVLRREE